MNQQRRVLSSFPVDSLICFYPVNRIIGATNNHGLLDPALFRRFDDVLHYDLPDETAHQRLIKNVLGSFKGRLAWKSILAASKGLSHAEIDHACRDAIKDSILSDQAKVETASLIRTFQERSQTHPRR